MFNKTMMAVALGCAFAAIALTPACSDSGTGISCADQCTCAGTPGGTCVSNCQTNLTAQENKLDKQGCVDQFNTYQSCFADNATCVTTQKDYALTAGSCADESTALNTCVGDTMDGTGGGGGSASTTSSTGN